MSCKVKCGGFQSVRTECAKDACLANGMCQVLDPSIKDCDDWCCQNKSGYVFLIVLFFCLGTFALCAMYYLHRLHKMNVESGAVTETGEMATVKVEPTDEELAATRRAKRNVTVDPEILKTLNTAASKS
ncbi:hypothetical protein AGDE_03305 [Angomonas deanei]|uniref:Uncharacterized protein n=1 Tax=Angomonas deanei TaxID=59799 RepID=S9VTW3_9TRYP|nr:hypothetical protein AGDE_11161 [Angomonas deanei]EPY40623.1 hypothetical protein AGDE_03305 [Angomonas deanei]CAD2221979.1 hypothetical protein, conserved [Angomonas deanei]|eukprot:EPY26650.1 hypothetical protein AGDE_11161 [Angomonas deanei]